MDVALALGPHRMGVAGDARLPRDPRAARPRLGEHRHPAQQQVGRVEPLARAHEGAQRCADHGQETVAVQRPAQRLVHQAEPAAAIVEGDAALADGPSRARRIVLAQVLADARQSVAHLDAERAQPLRLTDARQFEELRRVDRSAAHHDGAARSGFARLASDRIAHAGAAFALEQEPFGERPGLDPQVGASLRRIEVATGRTHAPARGDRGLAHGDAVLLGAVVVGIVRDPDFAGRLDHGGIERTGRGGIGDLQRARAAAKALVAFVVAFHALEEGKDVLVGPALVAHLRPGVEVLRLAAHEGQAVDGARAAEQFSARHRDAAAVGAGLGLGTVEPVDGRVGDQPRIADGNAGPGMAGGPGFQQQHLVARVGRQPVGDDGARRTGADDDKVVFHCGQYPATCPACRLPRRWPGFTRADVWA